MHDCGNSNGDVPAFQLEDAELIAAQRNEQREAWNDCYDDCYCCWHCIPSADVADASTIQEKGSVPWVAGVMNYKL